MVRAPHAPRPSCLMLGLFAILVFSCMVLPGQTMASEAPLDTLNVEALPLPEADPRYKMPDIPISRKLLPEAQATIVPTTTTPRRPPRLDDPMAARWHEYLAGQAKKQGNAEAELQNRDSASRAEPDNPRFLWPMVISALNKVDFPTLMETLPQAITLQLRNPVYRGPFVIAAQQGSLVLLGIFWSALVMALTMTWWRYLAHDLSALIFRGQNHRHRLWLPLILPVSFLIIQPGWFGFLALMSIPLLIQTRKHSRQLLAGTWIVAIILAFPMWPIMKDAVPTIDPSSEANLLVQAATLNASAELRANLEQRLRGAVEPDRINRLRVALAIQEARRGHFKTSNKLFKKVLATDGQNHGAMVGIANNMYFLGHLDTSADLFHQAALSHPQSGVILHNQAQVFFKKLFIPEAADALEKSRVLGYHPPVWQNQKPSNKNYSPVVYPGLSNQSLQAACSWESQNYATGITSLTWNGTLGSPPVPLFLLLSGALLLAGALIILWSHQHDPRECENCGVTVCGDCCSVREDSWLCDECGGIVDRARSDMILATLLKNRSRTAAMASASSFIHQSRLFPGAGHLAIGKTFAAWVRLSLMSWGIFLVSAAWAFIPANNWLNPGVLLPQETIHPQWIPLPVALWEGWLTPMALFGIGIIVAVWLLAFFDGSQLRHQMPERFSLTLSSTRGKDEITESRSVSIS